MSRCIRRVSLPSFPRLQSASSFGLLGRSDFLSSSMALCTRTRVWELWVDVEDRSAVSGQHATQICEKGAEQFQCEASMPVRSSTSLLVRAFHPG